MSWAVAAVAWHQTGKLHKLLEGGWEPFAVTQDRDSATVWLRLPPLPEKEVQADD